MKRYYRYSVECLIAVVQYQKERPVSVLKDVLLCVRLLPTVQQLLDFLALIFSDSLPE